MLCFDHSIINFGWKLKMLWIKQKMGVLGNIKGIKANFDFELNMIIKIKPKYPILKIRFSEIS